MNRYELQRVLVVGVLAVGLGFLAFAITARWVAHSAAAPEQTKPAAISARTALRGTLPAPETLRSELAAAELASRSPEHAREVQIRIAALQEENRRLATETADLRQRLSAVLNWILTNFRGKYPLPEPLFDRLQITPVTEDYTLHPDVAALFKITPEEEQKINDIFAYARTYLQQIEAALLTVTSPRPDKIILHIPPFVEHGQALREDLYAALEITLGPNRFDRFLRVTESGLKSSFYRFGEASRTLVFELVYAGDAQPPQLKIKDGWIVETGPNQRTIEAVESTVTNVPPQYAAYTAWLPESLLRALGNNPL